LWLLAYSGIFKETQPAYGKSAELKFGIYSSGLICKQINPDASFET
jgi:hypothetical protein